MAIVTYPRFSANMRRVTNFRMSGRPTLALIICFMACIMLYSQRRAAVSDIKTAAAVAASQQGSSSKNKILFYAMHDKYPFSNPSDEYRSMYYTIYKHFKSIVAHPSSSVPSHSGKTNDDDAHLVEEYVRFLVEQEKREGAVIILQLGVWLGQTLSKWMKISPKIHTIGVDTFKVPNAKSPSIGKLPDDMKKPFGTPAFNRGLTEYYLTQEDPLAPHRTILLYGKLPQVLQKPLLLVSAKYRPEIHMIYLNGHDKTLTPKTLQKTLQSLVLEFPDVVIAGNDYKTRGPQVHAVLHALATARGYVLLIGRQTGNTWIMLPPETATAVQRYGVVG